MITLHTGTAGLPDDFTESDYDEWTDYLAENITGACGLPVCIDCLPYGDAGADRVTGCADDSDRQAILDSAQALWADFIQTSALAIVR